LYRKQKAGDAYAQKSTYVDLRAQLEIDGKRMWGEELHNVVFLDVNHRAAADPEFASMLERFHDGKQTVDDILGLRKRIITPELVEQDGNSALLVDAPVLVQRNTVRTALNTMLLARWAHTTGAVLHVACADVGKTKGRATSEVELRTMLQEPDNDHQGLPGVGLWAVGMPAMVTKNQATELGLTNGLQGKVYAVVPDPADVDVPVVETTLSSTYCNPNIGPGVGQVLD
jgi:hypothetical protein